MGEIIEQILRLQQRHDVSSDVPVDVGQRELVKQGVHSCPGSDTSCAVQIPAHHQKTRKAPFLDDIDGG